MARVTRVISRRDRMFYYENPYCSVPDFQNAIKNVGTAPGRTYDELIKYMSSYPHDRSAMAYFVKVASILGRFEKAEIKLRELEKSLKEKNHPKSLREDRRNYLIARIVWLGHQQRYEEMQQLWMYNQNAISRLNDISVNALYWASKCLGYQTQQRDTVSLYRFRQILEYDEEDFWEHMKEKHLAPTASQESKDGKHPSVFNANFPAKEIHSTVISLLDRNNAMLSLDGYTETYIFRYPNCGVAIGKQQNYFKAIVHPGTKDVIAMYPFEGSKNMPHIDLTKGAPSAPSVPKIKHYPSKITPNR